MRTCTLYTEDGDFAAWFRQHSDCECLRLVGEVVDKNCDGPLAELDRLILLSKIRMVDVSDLETFTVKDNEEPYYSSDRRVDEWHFLVTFDNVMRENASELLNGWGEFETDAIPAENVLLRMVLNKDKSKEFVIEDGMVLSRDRSLLVAWLREDEYVALPTFLRHIGCYAFVNNNKMRSLVIGEGVTTIGAAAFANSDITTVKLPQTLEELGESAFCYCNLEDIKIPPLVRTVPAYCFFCNNLLIGDCTELLRNVRRVEEGAFGHNNIYDVLLPEGVEYVGYASFEDARSLYIPSTARFIDMGYWHEPVLGGSEYRWPKTSVSSDNPYYRMRKNHLIRNDDSLEFRRDDEGVAIFINGMSLIDILKDEELSHPEYGFHVVKYRWVTAEDLCDELYFLGGAPKTLLEETVGDHVRDAISVNIYEEHNHVCCEGFWHRDGFQYNLYYQFDKKQYGEQVDRLRAAVGREPVFDN